MVPRTASTTGVSAASIIRRINRSLRSSIRGTTTTTTNINTLHARRFAGKDNYCDRWYVLALFFLCLPPRMSRLVCVIYLHVTNVLYFSSLSPSFFWGLYCRSTLPFVDPSKNKSLLGNREGDGKTITRVGCHHYYREPFRREFGFIRFAQYSDVCDSGEDDNDDV